MREMKDSGIEWIGKIPAHWEVTKLKTNFAYEKGKNAALYTKEYVGLHKGSYPVYSGQTEDNGIMGTIDTFDYDLEECVFSTTVGAKVMTPMYLSGKFSLSQNCLIMKPIGTYLCKMLYYCLEPLFDYERKLIPSYMQPSLRFSDLNKYCLPQPPISEQQAIADYLDGECARIDGIVGKQHQIIERLKEYKKSVITEAVTRGLNPDVPMKDSGIEWIGKIPEHWKAGKTFYCLEDIGSGTTPSGEDYYTEDGINWLNTGDLTDGYIREIPKKITPKAMEDFSTLKLHQENSIVIAMYGATIGKLGIITEKTTTNQACCVMTPNKDLSYKFLFYCLYAGKDYMVYLSFGSGQPNINQNILRHFIIPHIPIEEQQAIADYLDGECARIDTIIEKRERMIELMTEYKKSLIYECVTGKKEIVDVVE